MENNELTTVINDSGVEQSTALMLQNSFMPFFAKAKEWKDKAESLVVTDVSQTREMKMAREARLALRDIRVEANKTRVRLKEDSNRYGRAVQGVYNVIEYLIVPIEKHLEDQERFEERLEEKRKAELQAKRELELQPYLEFVPYQVNLGELSDEGWDKLLSGAKLQMQAKIDAEKKAEEERIAKEKAEAEERKRIEEENKRLKAEAEERERKAVAALAEQKRLAEIQRKKQEELIAAERARAEEERQAAAKLAAELKAKQDAELAEKKRKEQEEKDRIAAEKKAAKAPDKTKLKKWVDDLTIAPPVCSTDEGKEIAGMIASKFNAFKAWAVQQTETL